jgi:hypothetical protein
MVTKAFEYGIVHCLVSALRKDDVDVILQRIQRYGLVGGGGRIRDCRSSRLRRYVFLVLGMRSLFFTSSAESL